MEFEDKVEFYLNIFLLVNQQKDLWWWCCDYIIVKIICFFLVRFELWELVLNINVFSIDYLCLMDSIEFIIFLFRLM